MREPELGGESREQGGGEDTGQGGGGGALGQPPGGRKGQEEGGGRSRKGVCGRSPHCTLVCLKTRQTDMVLPDPIGKSPNPLK